MRQYTSTDMMNNRDAAIDRIVAAAFKKLLAY
jgi:hypothetical protein